MLSASLLPMSAPPDLAIVEQDLRYDMTSCGTHFYRSNRDWNYLVLVDTVDQIADA